MTILLYLLAWSNFGNNGQSSSMVQPFANPKNGDCQMCQSPSRAGVDDALKLV
jgi:hypothetical protein